MIRPVGRAGEENRRGQRTGWEKEGASGGSINQKAEEVHAGLLKVPKTFRRILVLASKNHIFGDEHLPVSWFLMP